MMSRRTDGRCQLAAWLPYGWALLAVAVAAVVRLALDPLLDDHYPLGTFYAAVALVGWFFGVRPAILSAILGYLVGSSLFLSPRSGSLASYFHGLEFPAYAAICAAMIVLIYRIFDRQRRLDQALAAHALSIEQEKRTREAMTLSERRYRSISEAFDFGMWSADQKGRLTFASPRLLQFLGVTLQDAQDWLSSDERLPQSDIQIAARQWQTYLLKADPWDWECTLRGADGTERRVWTHGIPLRSVDGTITWAGFSLDVTARYAAEAARDQAHQRLALITDQMPVGVAQCNRQLEFVWVNPAYARQFGLTPEQLHGRRIEEVLGPEIFEHLLPYYLRVLAGESVQYEGPEALNGSPARWIHAVHTPIWNADATPVGWVAVVNDLTERRALEERLRDAHKQKDQFLATLAHELRNPLAPIRYATGLLKHELPPGMAADASQMIDRQLGHMARLLDDLLDVSRITRGTLEIRRERLDLRAVLREAIDMARPLADAVGHRLVLELPDHSLLVSGDETRLIQLLGNLINNAIKYTSAGGQISVSAAATNGKVAICVRDTGSGISAQLLPHVFDLFTQGETDSRAHGGLGIGLALAKQIVELHGGSIEAHSDGNNRGSEFRVLLAMAEELPITASVPGDASKVSVLSAGSVLIVDDNSDAADALAQMLKSLGYQTHVAYEGRTAIEMAEILKPSVVLLDLGLPHLSGREVAQRLRAQPWGRTAHLIALTGWGGENEVRRSREAGFDEHLTKPVDPEVLIRHMARLGQQVA
jgi:PAS domain S-box-containing protein